MDARALVEDLASRHGLVVGGYARVGSTPGAEDLERFIRHGRHGELRWLERQHPVRMDPRRRMPKARTAVVLLVEHDHQVPPRPPGLQGAVARYAWGRDYHNLVGKRLRKLRRDLRQVGVDSWGGVDSAPIAERAWARAAGVGFRGKHAGQILRGRSSWFFLAVLFVDQEIEPTDPAPDGCGTCRRCLDACPTGALVSPFVVDARLCLSTWTIEARGLPPSPIREALGDRFFGCDACQEVCPHNHAPPPCGEPDLAPRHAWIDLPEVLASKDEALMERFRGTPLRRPGAAGLKRNAALCLGNLGDPAAIPPLEQAQGHAESVVREAALWALARLRSYDPS